MDSQERAAWVGIFLNILSDKPIKLGQAIDRNDLRAYVDSVKNLTDLAIKTIKKEVEDDTGSKVQMPKM